MPLTVAGVIQLNDAPSSTSADSPPSGGVNQVLVTDADSPGAGGANTPTVVDGDSPNAGAPNFPTVTTGDSPGAGAGNFPLSTTGDSPNAGTTTEVLVANLLGRPLDGSERPADGSVGAYTAAAAFSDRPSMEHTAQQPGITVTGDDINTPGQERSRYRYRIDAEVELDRRTVDLVAGPVGQTVIFTAAVDQARVLVTRILLYAVDVSVVSVQPQIDLRKTALSDVLTQAALGFTATGQADQIDAASPSLAILTGEDLELGIDVLATATTYQVEVITLGRVIPT